MTAFVAVYDACVLYPSTTRDLLIRIAQAGLVQAKWTDAILDEVFDNLTTNVPTTASSACPEPVTSWPAPSVTCSPSGTSH